MAKVAKPKKREASIHSRAARREASPTAATTRVKPSHDEQNEHWLYSAQGVGISKKSKSKKLTHAQRLRQSKMVERAEKQMAVLENKVSKSKQKSRRIQARRQDWNDLNGSAAEQEAVEAVLHSDGTDSLESVEAESDHNSALDEVDNMVGQQDTVADGPVLPQRADSGAIGAT